MLPPGVAEALVVFDPIERRIHVAELLADALDEGTDVGVETFGTASCAETLATHHVVKLLVRSSPARRRKLKLDNFKLSQRQLNPDAPPVCPVIA